MTIRIHPIVPSDIPALAGVLARAFIADPMVVWPMVTDDDMEARIRCHYELVDTMFAAEGWMYRAEDGPGVMALIPPDSGERAHQIDGVMARAMAAITPDGGERYGRFWEWIEACHPSERHWLLDQLAVEPEAQGRGIGTAMLRFALERAAADGLPLFLETGVARNAAFYERFGFTVMRDAEAPDGGPHVWFMRWDPGARPTSVDATPRHTSATPPSFARAGRTVCAVGQCARDAPIVGTFNIRRGSDIRADMRMRPA